jgi:hypothetical protein
MVGGMIRNEGESEGESGGERGGRFGVMNMKISIRVPDHEIWRQND